MTEGASMVKRPRPDHCGANMEPTGRAQSPSPDKVSSAAAAMLKLSNSTPNPLPVFVMKANMGASIEGGLSPIGQPQVAFVTPKQETSSTSTSPLSITDSYVDVKPDIAALNMGVANRLSRKRREFTPDFKKDDHYWVKRRKNNEAAKRSREKRRMNDVVMGDTIMGLRGDNEMLKGELRAIKSKFGLPIDEPFQFDSTEFVIPVPASPSVSSGESSADSYLPAVRQLSAAQSVCSIASMGCSPLQQALANPPKTAKSNAPSTQPVTMTTTAIPFLIPVSSVHQPLAVVTNVPHQTVTSANPTLVTSLNVNPATPVAKISTNNHHKNGIDHTDTAVTSNGSDHDVTNSETNEAVMFHSKLKVPEVCQPISPDSSCGSRGSLHIVTSIYSGSVSDYSECDTSDDLDDHGSVPLNLCKRENEPCAPGYIEIKPTTDNLENAQPSVSLVIPHTLRQRLAQHVKERCGTVDETSQDIASGRDLSNQSVTSPPNSDADTSDKNDMQSGIGRDNTSIDPRYVERRSRNNEAARKCRENRKLMNEMRMAKSTLLETENERLKDELTTLATEVTTLKELIERKNAAKAKGEPFEPPPLSSQYEQEEVAESGEPPNSPATSARDKV